MTPSMVTGAGTDGGGVGVGAVVVGGGVIGGVVGTGRLGAGRLTVAGGAAGTGRLALVGGTLVRGAARREGAAVVVGVATGVVNTSTGTCRVSADMVDADSTSAGGAGGAAVVEEVLAVALPDGPDFGPDRRADVVPAVVADEPARGREETPGDASACEPPEGSPPPATVVAVPAVVAGPGPPSDWETTAPVIRPAAASPLMTPVATHRWLSQEAATGAAAKAAERDRAAARAAAMAWPSSATRRWSSAGDCRGWGSGGCGMASDYGSPAGRRGIPLSRPGR